MAAIFQSRRKGILPVPKNKASTHEQDKLSFQTLKDPNYTTTAEYAPIQESDIDFKESWDVREKPLPILPPLLRPHISTIAEFTSQSEYQTVPPNPVMTIPSIAASEDHQMKVLVSQAMQDACEYKVLTIKQMEQLRQEYEAQRNQIASLNSLLSYETKFLDSAHTLIRLHASNKYLLKKTSEELANAGRKVDEVANSLWKVTQRANQTQNRILHHTAGVLAVALFKVSSDQQYKLAKSSFAQSFGPSMNGKLQHIEKIDSGYACKAEDSSKGGDIQTSTPHDNAFKQHPTLHMPAPQRAHPRTGGIFNQSNLISMRKNWHQDFDNEPINKDNPNSIHSTATTNSSALGSDYRSDSTDPSVDSDYIEAGWHSMQTATHSPHQPQPLPSNHQDYPSLMTKLIALQDEVEAYRAKAESLEIQLQSGSLPNHLSTLPGNDGDGDERRHMVHALLQPTFLEKEKFRMEAESEARKRHELEEKVERLERELELCHLEEGEDIYLINMEQGRAIERLQKQLVSAIQDIDQLQQQGDDTNYILRQLFYRIPHTSFRNATEAHYAEQPSRYTLDRFVMKVTDLIEENHQLLDRVLDLQSRQERFERS
ncbi:hypothetical protein K493DRAFT_304468 [Basidiobolus meristosporus CBS 931.73]|uniref:Up-regulated during septation protein 1 domain-containing protein n=1 Tax=Basidiobolus meristosporus CBS 931.73 TaxID=1314790 RepID=A0A1Y1XZ03_9FUNG|nr:hypothetical protein K493DRAFT_304468 [Basidiobolus meristosporus CBS 931.73]|eukprot:ORX90968.1 hypothetical protein K493DRAFT_304468 [Basidiobolus meristosporus CBS 931.73]